MRGLRRRVSFASVFGSTKIPIPPNLPVGEPRAAVCPQPRPGARGAGPRPPLPPQRTGPPDPQHRRHRIDRQRCGSAWAAKTCAAGWTALPSPSRQFAHVWFANTVLNPNAGKKKDALPLLSVAKKMVSSQYQQVPLIVDEGVLNFACLGFSRAPTRSTPLCMIVATK